MASRQRFVCFALAVSLPLALYTSARAGTGDVAPTGAPDGSVNIGDALVALAMLSGAIATDLEADVFPLNLPDGPAGDGMLTLDDVATLFGAAYGTVTIPGGGTGGGELLVYTGSLHGLDPAELAMGTVNPIEIDANPTGTGDSDFVPIGLITGDLDTSGPTAIVSNIRNGAIMYTRTEPGTLWRIDPRAGAGTPTPERISSESGIEVCDAVAGPDIGDILQFRVAYRSVPSGMDCSAEGTWRMVRAGMSAATPPIDLPGEPLFAIFDVATGTTSGWLVNEMGKVRRYDRDFTMGEDTGITFADSIEEIAFVRPDHFVFNVDGALVSYKASTRAVKDASYTFGRAFGGGRAPLSSTFFGGEFFFVDNDFNPLTFSGTAPTVYAYDPDVDATPRVLDVTTDGSGLQPGLSEIFVIGDRVVYTYLSNSLVTPATILASVGIDGTGRFEIDRASAVLIPVLSTSEALGGTGFVFYNGVVAVGPMTTFYAAAADVSTGDKALSVDAAAWVGEVLGASPIEAFGNLPAERMLLASGIAGLGEQGGGTLLSVDAVDPAATSVELGTIPADISTVLFLPGRGPDRLGIAIEDLGGSTQFDVVYINAERAGSLLRITDTEDVSEIPAVQF
ncbi:MAG: hypothetical protein KC466_19790 [Myxococcales bacterium]|nr:hypothetical protein [Myxococcales bacterium]